MAVCVLYHHPESAMSWAAIDWLGNHDVEVSVVSLNRVSMSMSDLKSLCLKLNKRPQDIIRYSEPMAYDLNLINPRLPKADDDYYQLLCQMPLLMQRPICVTDHQAVIGRPLDNITALFERRP